MKKITQIQIEHLVDEVPDLSYLGEYTATLCNGDIDKGIDRKSRGDWSPGEMPFFVPYMTGEETGNPNSPEEDYQRSEAYNRGDWRMIGIRATARLIVDGVRQTIRTAGLWGIESDSSQEYFDETGEEELKALRSMLRELGFTTEEISEAAATK